jgi:peptide deformylase
MSQLPILIVPDPRLKQKAKPVAAVDARIRRLMDDMAETMYAAPGIGLAAPQVGALERVIVVDVAEKDAQPNLLRMANPELVWTSDDTAVYNEGCLSLPDQYAEVTRPRAIRVRYLDHDGIMRDLETDGLLSTCIQHEIDHLDGILFVDHLSALKRGIILRKLQKARKAKASA